MLLNKNDTFVPHLIISYTKRRDNYDGVYITGYDDIKYKITGEDKNGIIEIMFKNEFILPDYFIDFLSSGVKSITLQNETDNLIILNTSCINSESGIDNCNVYGKFKFKENCICSENTGNIHIYGPNCIFEDTAFEKDVTNIYYYDKITQIKIKLIYTNVAYAHPHILYDLMKYNNVEEGDVKAQKYHILDNTKLYISSPTGYISKDPSVDLGNNNYIYSINNYMYEGNYITEYVCDNNITHLRNGITLRQNTTVYFPDTVTDISNNTFQHNRNLKKVVIFGNCELSYLDGFDDCGLENIEIYSDRIIDIKHDCFSWCIKLLSFIIPESVIYIGRQAFQNIRVKSLYIPKNVSSIGDNVIVRSINLETIIVDENNSKYDSRNNCNAIIDNNRLIQGCKNTIIPTDIDSIASYAFYDMDLKEIIIPNNIVYLGSYVFKYNPIDNIIIPESIIYIGTGCFSGTNISNNENNWINGILYISNCIVSVKDGISGEITILDNTRLICYIAFSNRGDLTKINIPNSLEYINDHAFSNMGDLTIEYDGTEEEWNNIIKGSDWDRDTNITYIFKQVPPNNEIWYTSTDGNIIDVDTTYINNNLLSNTYEDKGKLVFEKDVNNILSLFEDKTQLTEVWLPNIKIIDSISTFKNCNNLIKINNSEMLPVSESTCANCINLKEFIINSDWVGDFAFDGCVNLQYIKIPKTVTRIEVYSLRNCTSLESIDYEGTIEEWNNIDISSNWYYGSAITTIHCTDGDIQL